MTRSLSGFDDWLNRQLEESAREAGEDVVTYVARAVASRMVTEQRRVSSHSIVELMAHLSASGAFAELVQNNSATVNDPDRLRSLYATGLLDTPPEEVFDRITRAAAAALDAPRSAISLIDVDRQFFKSTVGMGGTCAEARQTPLEWSMCQYTVANGAALVVEDARNHPAFKNHPAVLDGNVVAYLGIPLMDDDRNAIGTVCVFDDKPRLWSTGHIQVLNDLAGLAAVRIFGDGPSREL